MAVSKLLKAKKVVNSTVDFKSIAGDKMKFKSALQELGKIGRGREKKGQYLADYSLTVTQKRILSTAQREQKQLFKKTQDIIGNNPNVISFIGYNNTKRTKLVEAAQLSTYSKDSLKKSLRESPKRLGIRKYGMDLIRENDQMAKLLKNPEKIKFI